MHKLAIFLAHLPSLVLASATPPSFPTIRGFTTGGAGCPQGSNTRHNGNLGNFVVTFEKWRATGPVALGASCKINLDLIGGSPGWQVALADVTLAGDVSTRETANVAMDIKSYWSGVSSGDVSTSGSAQTGGGSSPISLRGSLSDDKGWSPCIKDASSEAAININARLGLSTSDSSLQINTEQLGFRWRTCTP